MPHQFSYLLNDIKENMNYHLYISTILGWLNLLIIENCDLRERINARSELASKNFFVCLNFFFHY